MKHWKDVTSYGQHETDRTPRSWELDVGGIRVRVHRVQWYKSWYVKCCVLSVDEPLAEPDIADAQDESLRLIHDKLCEWEKCFAEIIDADGHRDESN